MTVLPPAAWTKREDLARLIAALPPMTRVAEEQDALDWLATLAASH